MPPRSSLVRSLWLVPAAAAAMVAAPAHAQSGISIDEALASAFPLPAEVDRRTDD